MSENVLCTGKLIPCILAENETVEDFYKEQCLTEKLEKYMKDYDSWEECYNENCDEFKFIRKDNTIYKVQEELSTSDCYHIQQLRKNSDGSFDYLCFYYNGGTCLSECIEEELAK